MAGRPGRSSSIPIPRNPSVSSSARNIESVISIPTASPSRPLLTSTRGLSRSPRGVNFASSVSMGHRLSHDSASVSISPTRLLSRSAVPSTSHTSHSPVRIGINFEPRVVHASQDSSRSIDNSCIPSQSPTQSRGAGGVGGRSVSAQRHMPSVPPLPNAASVSFSRPTYLDHSALRDLLVTETSSPTLAGLAFPRKITPARSSASFATSPSTDSDEDNSPSPPPPTRETRVVSAPVIPEEPRTYALPTRWSDQARSDSLSVSHDGRELSHRGTRRVEESIFGNRFI